MDGGKDKIFRLAELFSGPGGLALGATQASAGPYSITSVWANDIDKDTCVTYRNNLHKDNLGKVEHKPIQDVEFDKIPKFDALAFGFPCNDFSLVGEQKGFDGKYGPLYSYGVKAINAQKPDWFIAENVTGLRSANNGGAFRRILDDLENAGDGYDVVPHLYKFEEYGVPQTRHRIVIVGTKKSLGLNFKVPSPTTEGSPLSAKRAIENPAIPANAPNHEKKKQSIRVAERLAHIPPGGNAWSEEIPAQLRLNVKGARLSNIYKRLDPDLPAYTITGSGGGGTHVYHWDEPRALTNRERARLQTFPDDFVFCGTNESVRKQIGMAVPPLAARQIIEAVLKTFAGIEYEYVPQNLELKKQNSIPLVLT